MQQKNIIATIFQLFVDRYYLSRWHVTHLMLHISMRWSLTRHWRVLNAWHARVAIGTWRMWRVARGPWHMRPYHVRGHRMTARRHAVLRWRPVTVWWHRPTRGQMIWHWLSRPRRMWRRSVVRTMRRMRRCWTLCRWPHRAWSLRWRHRTALRRRTCHDY